MAKYAEWGKEVLAGEIAALELAKSRMGADFEKAAKLVKACRGKVVVTGLGKSGHIGKKIAATMSSLGTPSFFLHSGEALHGDSGMMGAGDLVIAISNSGTTKEVVAAAEVGKRMGLKIVSMTGKPDSPLGKIADAILDISAQGEADHMGLAPTSSSTVTLAIGDALAVAVSRAKGFTASDFAFFHAGGALGKASKKATGKK